MTPTTHPHRAEWMQLGLALLLLGLGLGYLIYSSHRGVDSAERDRLQVQARVVEDNLARQIEGVNQALLSVQAALMAPEGARIGPGQAPLLQALRNAMPGVHMLAHVGADGTVIAANQEDVIGMSRAERAYFQRAKAMVDPSLLYVAEPYVSATGVWTIALVRALTGPGGEFAGLVEAGLEPAYFNVVLGSVLYAPDMRAVLMHGNGTLFLNVPPNDATLGAGVDKPGSFFRRHLDSGMPATLLSGKTLAGEGRIAALRTLQPSGLRMDWPLVIALGRDEAAVLGHWHEEALIVGGMFALLAVTASLGLHRIQRRRLAHQEQAAAHAAELSASEARFRSLTRLSSDWYWEQDASMRFVRIEGRPADAMNMSFELQLGVARWEIPTPNLSDADWDCHRATLEARQTFRDFVMLRRDAQGDQRWVSVSGEPVFGASGAFRGYRGTGRDITGQMRAEQALQKSEERLQLMLRGSHDAPWDLELASRRLWLAQRWQTLMGYELDEECLSNSRWRELCHPDDTERTFEFFSRAVVGDVEHYELEMRLRHRDGHYVPMLMRGYILRDAKGRALRASGVNTDLTERKRAEADRQQLAREQAAQQLHQAELAAAGHARLLAEQHAQGLQSLLAERDRTIEERDRLLGLLAHEVRQPLNNASAAIQGAAMAMREPQGSRGDATGRLERAQWLLDQVSGTVNNALAASTLLASAEPIHIQEAEIDTVIALAVADLGAQARSRVQGQRVTRGRTAELNIALVRLALRNLLANALAYSPGDSVVELRIDLADDPLALVIEVRDSGDGIAAELLPVIFERGTRGPRAAEVQGAGLGLYVVARVVELHRGSIAVLPNAPRGTVFRIVLPQGQLG